MSRTIRAEVVGMFNRLCTAVGYKAYRWKLDYAACYGGYVIEDYDENGVMQPHPFGYQRRPGGEMYSALCLACEAVEMMKKEHEQHLRGL